MPLQRVAHEQRLSVTEHTCGGREPAGGKLHGRLAPGARRRLRWVIERAEGELRPVAACRHEKRRRRSQRDYQQQHHRRALCEGDIHARHLVEGRVFASRAVVCRAALGCVAESVAIDNHSCRAGKLRRREGSCQVGRRVADRHDRVMDCQRIERGRRRHRGRHHQVASCRGRAADYRRVNYRRVNYRRVSESGHPRERGRQSAGRQVAGRRGQAAD